MTSLSTTIPQGAKAELTQSKLGKENRRGGGGRQADTVVGDSSETSVTNYQGDFSSSRCCLIEMKSSNTVFCITYF